MSDAVFSQADLAALKAADTARAYAERVLGAPKREGASWYFPCPFHAHARPKLRIDAAPDGAGLAVCKADGVQGDVFTLAAAVLGMDARRDFAACVREVAEKTGYTLRADAPGVSRKPARRGRAGMFNRITAAGTPRLGAQEGAERADAAPLAYLSADDEAAALEAVRRAAGNVEQMARHADALGLPLSALLVHTDIDDAAGLGLLGLDTAGRLLYVYTRMDGGRVRVLMVKRRNSPDEVAQGAPRFLCKGSKQALYGADAARGCGEVFITEGESDALAVRAAVWCFMDDWAHNSPDDFPQDDMPAVVAKPDAGTFRAAWADELRGKSVTLIQDADDAGQAGASKTAAVLRAAGVRRVHLWMPRGGAKDARAAFDLAHPCDLADDILMNRKEMAA
ncbi:MAG: hypothetical protein Q4E43_07855 [Akkermansia sp.]|nr:hypothetical protein [Akkermansia sp.]